MTKHDASLILSAKKRIFSCFVAGLCLLQFGIIRAQIPVGVNKVVIDPGHGGKDPGAIGKNKVYEKVVALDVSLKLGKLIKDAYPKVEVVYTRSTDEFIGLAERATKANFISADLFISIHANSVANSKPHGTETWVLGLHKSEAAMKVAERENASMLMEEDYESKYQDFDPSDPNAYIGLALQQSEYLDQSLALAHYIQKNFKTKLKRVDRGVKQAGFMVLWRTTMPSILIELGFLSNPAEEKFLASKAGQNKLAKEIFEAFKTYKTQIDGVNESIKEEEPIPTPGSGDSNQTGGIIFKVQLATSRNRLTTDPWNFKGLKNVEIYEIGKMYRYTVGRFSTFDEAKIKRQEVKKLGYNTAFIVAYKGTKRLDLDDAIARTKK